MKRKKEKKKESKLKQGSGVCVGACRHRLSFAPLSSVRPAQRRKGRALFSSFFISSSTFFCLLNSPLFSLPDNTHKNKTENSDTHRAFFSSLSSSLIQSHLSSQAIWWSFATRQCNQYQPKSRGNQTGYSTTTLISMLFQSLFRRKMNWKWRQTPQSRSLSLHARASAFVFCQKIHLPVNNLDDVGWKKKKRVHFNPAARQRVIRSNLFTFGAMACEICIQNDMPSKWRTRESALRGGKTTRNKKHQHQHSTLTARQDDNRRYDQPALGHRLTRTIFLLLGSKQELSSGVVRRWSARFETHNCEDGNDTTYLVDSRLSSAAGLPSGVLVVCWAAPAYARVVPFSSAIFSLCCRCHPRCALAYIHLPCCYLISIIAAN